MMSVRNVFKNISDGDMRFFVGIILYKDIS